MIFMFIRLIIRLILIELKDSISKDNLMKLLPSNLQVNHANGLVSRWSYLQSPALCNNLHHSQAH